MTERFDGKVALITGAGRGIGRNIARAFGTHGAAVAIADIDSDAGQATLLELLESGIKAELLPADLVHGIAAKNLVDQVVKRLGRLDIVVNNARAGKRVLLENETEENWDQTMGVNLKAVFFIAQAAFPIMRDGGSLINIGSVSGQLVSDESPSYHASKAGLLHLTRYLAVRGGPRGIRVNAVSPGFIVQDEHLARYARDDNVQYRESVTELHPLRGAPGHSDDVAHAVLFLASPESAFITGQTLTVDGGLTIQDQAALLLSQRMRP